MMQVSLLYAAVLPIAEIFDQVQETLAPSKIIGVVVWLFLYIWQLRMVAKGKWLNGGLKRMEAAKAAGRVVEARLVSSKRYYNEPGVNRTADVYVYEVDGKTYEKRFYTSHSHSPKVITLYYDKSPRNAKTRSEMKGHFSSVFPLISSLLAGAAAILLLERFGL